MTELDALMQMVDAARCTRSHAAMFGTQDEYEAAVRLHEAALRAFKDASPHLRLVEDRKA